MDPSAFNPETMFMAVFQAADSQTGTGYGQISLEFFVQEDASGSVKPVSVSEVAGAIRDYLEPRGWAISQFSGAPAPQALDWPEGS